MGFPAGISGSVLANQGYLQAMKFGAEFTAPVSVVSMARNNAGEHCLLFCTDQTNQTDSEDCSAAFVFVGAKPHTEWLHDSIGLDAYGYVLTGSTVQNHAQWQLDRTPCELETTSPGVFASGDVRSGTTKRCAFAVGDDALAITCMHQYLS